MKDTFSVRDTLEVNGQRHVFASLMKILLENLLRHEDGVNVTSKEIEAIAKWDPKAEPDTEIAFMPARVLMQDFTGVPCVVDLAAMRDAMVKLGGDPKKINPLAPAELVIDHSVQVDEYGTGKDALAAQERRDRVRAQPGALRVPALGPEGVQQLQGRAARHRHRAPGQPRVPGRVVFPRVDGESWPIPTPGRHRLAHHHDQRPRRARLGRRRHRGRGGHARPAVSMLIPQVVGFKLTGKLPEGAPPPTWC
jgi:aconitate hydratase